MGLEGLVTGKETSNAGNIAQVDRKISEFFHDLRYHIVHMYIYIYRMDPWPLSEKVRLTLQIIVHSTIRIPQTLPHQVLGSVGILWMEEILHQLIGGLSRFQPSKVVQDFFHPP